MRAANSLSRVWGPGPQLLLLQLALEADDRGRVDGLNLNRIAMLAGAASTDQGRRRLRSLIDAGAVAASVRGGPPGTKWPLQINLSKLSTLTTDCNSATPTPSETATPTGGNSASDGLQNRGETGSGIATLTKQSSNKSEAEQKDPAKETTAAAAPLEAKIISQKLRQLGVAVGGDEDAILLSWIYEGYTLARIEAAVAIAASRDNAARPLRLPYINKIVRDPTATAAVKLPWTEKWSGIVAKGAEFGLRVEDFEHEPAFKQAVLDAARAQGIAA